jgi:hypothetical protein
MKVKLDTPMFAAKSVKVTWFDVKLSEGSKYVQADSFWMSYDGDIWLQSQIKKWNAKSAQFSDRFQFSGHFSGAGGPISIMKMPKVVKLHAPSTHISNSKCPKFRLSTDQLGYTEGLRTTCLNPSSTPGRWNSWP